MLELSNMATNSNYSQLSSHDQELAIFLADILKTTQMLKESIALLTAKYPVTARDKSIDELIDKLQQDIQNKIDLIEPPASPSPLPSELSEESIPSPAQEVVYSVELYDSSVIRRRTMNNLGNLGQSLPRKKKVKETVNVEILTKDKYDPQKRAMTWVKSKEYSTLTASSIAESERYLTHGSVNAPVSLAQAIIIDVGKLNFKTQSAPYFLFDSKKHDSNQGVFSLLEHAQLKTYDHNDCLETAIKIARANYEYWSSAYYRGLSTRDKDPAQRELMKEYLRSYVKDPLRSKGVIYFYQVKKTLQNRQLQSQVYIGRSEGLLEEKLQQLHQSCEDEPLLVKLALQSHTFYSEEKDNDIKTKNIAFILDFGYTEVFFDKHKDRLDKGDKLVTLEKNYIEYFGTRSPIGLN